MGGALADDLAPGAILASYRIVELLGRGGMGEVYLAEDLRLKRKVALKVLSEEVRADPSSLGRFHREAEAAAALHHSNICTIFEIAEAGDRTFIVMELCEGTTLRERIAAQPLAIDDVLEIGIQIADALEEARKRRVVHRDIKSSNILVGERNQVKVLDFGLAKQFLPHGEDWSRVSTALDLTGPGIPIGTPHNMSPEQMLGKPVDHRSDIFSFGVVLYEMLTGTLPFRGETTVALVDAILREDPPPIARYNERVPDPLIRVVGRMLAKRPDDRYQSAHEVWVDLCRIRVESSMPAGSGPPAAAERTPATSAFRRGVVAAASLAAVAAIALAVAWLRPQPRPPLAGPRAITSLVALPATVSGSTDFAYLTDAVPSTISTQLSKLREIDTKLPPTSFEVEKVDGDLRRLAQLFGVDAFVVSSVVSEAEGLLVSVQLVDAQTRSLLWTGEYEGTRGEYLRLARGAADGIREFIQPDAGALASAPETTVRSEAELAFQQGRYYANRFNNLRERGDFDIAQAALKRALDLDPALADAAAFIGALYAFQLETGNAYDEALVGTAERWARQALEIDPGCGLAWSVLAHLFQFRRDPDMREHRDYGVRAAYYGAREGLALIALPNVTLAASAALQLVGYDEVRRVEPLYLFGYTNASEGLLLTGRPQQALDVAEPVLAIEPDAPVAVFDKAAALIDLRRGEDAAPLVAKTESYVADGRLPAAQALVLQTNLALERDGRAAAAVPLAKLLDVVRDPTTPLFLRYYSTLAVQKLARHGETTAALEILERNLEAGYAPLYDVLLLNPDLAPLRSDARFRRVLERARTDFEEMRDPRRGEGAR